MSDWFFTLRHPGLRSGDPVLFCKTADLSGDDAKAIREALDGQIDKGVTSIEAVDADKLSLTGRLRLDDLWRNRRKWLPQPNFIRPDRRCSAQVLGKAHDMAQGMAAQLRAARPVVSASDSQHQEVKLGASEVEEKTSIQPTMANSHDVTSEPAEMTWLEPMKRWVRSPILVALISVLSAIGIAIAWLDRLLEFVGRLFGK